MDCDNDKMDDLLPKRATIGRRRRTRKKVSDKPTKTPVQKKITPALVAFESIDPFKNTKTFVSFYRSIIRSYGDMIVEFPGHGADREYAARTMDSLIDIGREKDLVFLRAWIKYYAEYKLKGDDFENYNKTSIRSFNGTLEEYQKKHIDL